TKVYEGILYDAIMGAKLINCSWVSESSGSLENDIIRAVNFLGACVVAAAGNDGKYSDFAPASLNGVLSVAAVDSNDVKAGFSNFSSNVEVSAPGVKILSTTPNNTYAAWDGTSMASPIAAGVVALARLNFPNLNFEQIYELVKRQSDNIDSLNPLYSGLLGAGRVNAFNTLNCNPDTIRSIILMAYSTEDLDGDNLFLPNDTIKVSIKVKNVFSDLTGVIGLVPDDIHYVKNVIKSKLYIGAVPNSAIVQSPDSVLFVLSDTLPLDFSLKVPIFLYDSHGLISRYYIEIKVNPSDFIGSIFKWVLVIVALLVAVEILGLPQFAALLNRFLGWLPNLIVAIAILIVAIIAADILQKIIKASAQKIGVKYVG
ncbi:MAG: S8 family peptidase, partial [Candidatus Kapaibacteriota bacterium]